MGFIILYKDLPSHERRRSYGYISGPVSYTHLDVYKRQRLRYLLFEVAMSLVSKNREFRELHRYYTTRAINPLKKMQSLMAVAAKLIRVFYAMMTKNVDYDPVKMISDIKRPTEYMQAA